MLIDKVELNCFKCGYKMGFVFCDFDGSHVLNLLEWSPTPWQEGVLFKIICHTWLGDG